MEDRYGTRVALYFRQNSTSYKTMYRFTCREATSVPNLLMVDCKSASENRKWATFYTNRERADLLATALNVDSKLGKCLASNFQIGWGRK